MDSIINLMTGWIPEKWRPYVGVFVFLMWVFTKVNSYRKANNLSKIARVYINQGLVSKIVDFIF